MLGRGACLTTALLVALWGPGCRRTARPAEEPAAAPGTEREGRPSAPRPTRPDPTRPLEPSPRGEAAGLRAPRAEDLAAYVADLGGDGPLIATIETTVGNIRCELLEKAAPATVANFVGLARGKKPFLDVRANVVTSRPLYDGLTFHRVVPGLLVQSGDPLGGGPGGPGYTFADEMASGLRLDAPGRLAMANHGPNTNGSQFFITRRAVPELDGHHAIFGVCRDLEVVAKIEGGGPGRDGGPPGQRATSIRRVTIAR